MRRNKHEIWQQFCTLHSAVLAATELPESVTWNEHRFRDLLREGTAASGETNVLLASLGDGQWSALERFATVFFREFESWAPLDVFPAFRRETERRQTGFFA